MPATDKTDADPNVQANPADADESSQPLKLKFKIEERGACQRHVTVTIPRDEIDRYYDNAFREMLDTATIPGFRPGHAPRRLIEQRFRKEVKDQVKGSLLMDALTQVTEESELATISEPDLDVMAVELPDEGPMVFEFDLEVRPEFDVPNWKGLKIERPVREFTDQDVDLQLERVLANRGRLVPYEGPAEVGDYITVNLTFKDGDRVLSHSEEEVLRIRPVLSFRDARIENFDKLMSGIKSGETREVEVTISDQGPVDELRGKAVTGVFEVIEVKRLELPELTPEFLDELGDFECEADLRDAIRDRLERQLQYEQQQQTRKQVLETLTEAADWELPPDLVNRQTRRELDRMVMELRSAGFSEDAIHSRTNQLWQNSQAATRQALKEHFILERLAEEEEIDAAPDDYEEEIRQIARQVDQSPRRVRAHFEKQDLMDSLRNQIVERKVIELILSHAQFQDKILPSGEAEEYAVDQLAAGEDKEEIPEAKYSEAAQSLREPEDRS